MAIFPALLTSIAFVFAIQVVRQYRRRHRLYQIIWAFSLTCGALAGTCFLAFLFSGRDPTWFRAYYIFGALLMAAYLGMGSVALLAPRKWALSILAVLATLSVVGIATIVSAPVNTVVLHEPNVEAGSNAISGPAIVFVALLNSFGAAAVIGGACYSAWLVWRRAGPGRLLLSNGLIALGTIFASLAGALARVANSGGYFWSLLAIGFAVLYAGFTIASRPMRPRSSP